MARLRQLWIVGACSAVFVVLLAPSAARAARGGTGRALVVCAKQKNEKVVNIRAGQCRAGERLVPLDADTLQGLTPQQLMSARPASSGSAGPAGPSLVDGVGQLVGYVILTQSGTAVVRPAGTGLVGLNVQHAIGGGAEVYWSAERALTYFYQSADCSGAPLLLNGSGYDAVIRQGHIVVDQQSKVSYAGDFDSSRSLGLTGVQSHSRPVDDETGTCSHDVGDPASVPIAGGRCCTSLAPYTELKQVGPLVTEDLPAFIQPFHFGGF